MLLYLSILVVTLIVCLVHKRYAYWKDRGVAYVHPIFPAGNLLGLGRTEHLSALMERCYKQLKGTGPFGGIFFFTNPVALALDLDFIKATLVKDFQHFQDRSLYSNEKDDPLSTHLVTMGGTKWKYLRAKITPMFTSGKVKMMFPTFVGVADELQQLMNNLVSKGCDIEIKEILARFTTDLIGSCAFGLQLNSLQDPDAEFRRMGRKVFTNQSGGVLKMVLAQQYRTIAHALHVTAVDSDVSRFFINAMKESIEYREKNAIERNDFMDLLIKLKNAEPLADETASSFSALTVEEVAAQAFVFFQAGYEISTTVMSYCLYELALNTKLQDKARNNVLDSVKKHGSMTYEVVQDLHYIDQCINESLRKYPPAATLTRTVTKEYTVSDNNVTLKKGSTLVIPVYALHHDPEYYPEPERYDPERFTPDQIAKRNPYCYLPFGEGPRMCIGMRFGMMQARLGLAYLLKDYRFTLSSKTPVPLKISARSIGLSSEGGLWLNLEKL